MKFINNGSFAKISQLQELQENIFNLEVYSSKYQKSIQQAIDEMNKEAFKIIDAGYSKLLKHSSYKKQLKDYGIEPVVLLKVQMKYNISVKI